MLIKKKKKTRSDHKRSFVENVGVRSDTDDDEDDIAYEEEEEDSSNVHPQQQNRRRGVSWEFISEGEEDNYTWDATLDDDSRFPPLVHVRNTSSPTSTVVTQSTVGRSRLSRRRRNELVLAAVFLLVAWGWWERSSWRQVALKLEQQVRDSQHSSQRLEQELVKLTQALEKDRNANHDGYKQDSNHMEQQQKAKRIGQHGGSVLSNDDDDKSLDYHENDPVDDTAQTSKEPTYIAKQEPQKSTPSSHQQANNSCKDRHNPSRQQEPKSTAIQDDGGVAPDEISIQPAIHHEAEIPMIQDNDEEKSCEDTSVVATLSVPPQETAKHSVESQALPLAHAAAAAARNLNQKPEKIFQGDDSWTDSVSISSFVSSSSINWMDRAQDLGDLIRDSSVTVTDPANRKFPDWHLSDKAQDFKQRLLETLEAAVSSQHQVQVDGHDWKLAERAHTVKHRLSAAWETAATTSKQHAHQVQQEVQKWDIPEKTQLLKTRASKAWAAASTASKRQVSHVQQELLEWDLSGKAQSLKRQVSHAWESSGQPKLETMQRKLTKVGQTVRETWHKNNHRWEACWSADGNQKDGCRGNPQAQKWRRNLEQYYRKLTDW